MKIKRHFYLMISCPGDVVNERKLLKDCVETINSERADDVWVELQYWATDTSSDAGMLAQDSINEQIVRDSDGLIAIFNARLGTPVHEYVCGTDEEIDLMLKAGKHVSLLFNTKPQIDLSNPSSIEQITKLQNYKEEQSKKAYYREFSDDESFISLAKREIRLWLRGICDNVETPQAQKHNTSKDERVQNLPIPIDNVNRLPVGNSMSETEIVDTPAGALDCVVIITEATQVIANEIDNFNRVTVDISEKANAFGQKFSLYKKQNNGDSGLLVLCKRFANELDQQSTDANGILEKIEIKWHEIYQYIMVYANNYIRYQDRIIIKDSFGSLRSVLHQNMPQMDELINVLSSMPNYQKNLKNSTNTLTNVYKRFRMFAVKAISDCDEIDSRMMIDELDEI